ncbi:unnamed protein product [Phytophthora lilii]|uniref:Unnamed protein product n=1 Tax=Phytophthora lilii TaxID=2077276 RepID=A0A9W7D9E7_9STRA|nr:unnamed protein product [Phytophthora lilii]
MVKKTARVYVGDTEGTSKGTDAVAPESTAAEKKARRKLVARLSHDISTEQLFSDDLIDGKVADGEDDEAGSGSDTDGQTSHDGDDRGPAKQGRMYRIESHSALSSLEAKYLEKVPSTEGSLATSMEPRPTARTHKLAPLPGSPTARNAETASPGLALRPTALFTTPEKEEASAQQVPQVCSQCSKSREMPPMHCAAYSGHTTCLEILLQKADAETEALNDQNKKKKNTWLDKKQRTPLFYACAADRLECCDLLARVRRVWLNTADRQMDTPVHVCCFFGWHKCLQLLLDAGADPHGRNAKGFKPSHLAATPECLEALLAFGDDLLQGDELGRSPLFVACARNRVACVEFLCAWNNQSRSWMLELEDQRGDRAIHAAACNGSTASLAVLLRYGADPLTNNAKGMSPKDLAAANKHPECEELLAQAEKELAASAGTSWLAPANAAASGDNNLNDTKYEGTSSDWVQCWDNDSGQAFYYNNLTGKCQWEVPPGFEAFLDSQLRQSSTSNSQQYDTYGGAAGDSEDGNEEYVWVKKKKQTVCVVTGRETEWTAVQDPVSRAIYYKNTRTGQSQWEEPDAVRELANAAVARTSQEASRVWEDLDKSRSALAGAIAREKRRQLEAHEQTLLQARLHVRQRREDIAKREEQARLAQLLPRSSFVRRKKQSMMMKVTTHNRQATKTTSKVMNGRGKRQLSLGEALNENDEDNESPANENEEESEDGEGAEARLEEICANEPALDMFLSTYLKLRGVRDLQVLTTEKRLSNCLFHYYVALVDPVNQRGMSKCQFRVVLRDMNVIPGGAPALSTSISSLVSAQGGAGGNAPPLKLHVTDLIFSQAERTMAQEGSPTHTSRMAHRQAAPLATAGDTHLSLSGFTAAMLIVRERVVAQAEQLMQQASGDDPEIDDDEEWFMLRYLVPLSLRLGAKLLTQIRRCKELDLQLNGSQETTAVAARQFLAANRAAVQLLHRHYSRRELSSDTEGAPPILSTPKAAAAPRRLAMLTFRGLAMFAGDFSLLTPGAGLPALHFLLEAINWISGSAHTEVISFEKFQLILVVLAVLPLSPPHASSWASWIGENDSSGSSSQAGSRLLAEPVTAFFKRLAGSPALVGVTAESNIVTSDEGGADSEPASIPCNPQSLFVFEVPPTDSNSLNNQE